MTNVRHSDFPAGCYERRSCLGRPEAEFPPDHSSPSTPFYPHFLCKVGPKSGTMSAESGAALPATCSFYLVGEAGLEPATPGLEGRCSIQLSYSPAEGCHKTIVAPRRFWRPGSWARIWRSPGQAERGLVPAPPLPSPRRTRSRRQ
jgi:hypothetical protein